LIQAKFGVVAERADVDLVDADLVDRMARGDRVAMIALYDAYSPSMLAVGARILGERREAPPG